MGYKTEEQMYYLVKVTFRDMKKLARQDLKKSWWRKNLNQRMNAGRGLAYMSGVIKNPGANFSRIATEEQWQTRALEYANMYNINPTWQAYDMVASPSSVLNSKMQPAIDNAQLKEFCACLCNAVEKWEYARTVNGRDYSQEEQDIIRLAQNMVRLRIAKQSCPVKKAFSDFIKSFQR